MKIILFFGNNIFTLNLTFFNLYKKEKVLLINLLMMKIRLNYLKNKKIKKRNNKMKLLLLMMKMIVKNKKLIFQRMNLIGFF